MQKRILAVFAALLSLAAPAFAQQFPATLPAGTVFGRLSIVAGPGQAIPLATLGSVISPFLASPAYYDAVATYKVVCNGVHDDTTQLAAAITAANVTGGIVQLPGKGAICLTSQTLVLGSGVILQGGGMAGASVSLTTTKFGTTIKWTGGKGSTVVQFTDSGVAMGVRDLRIDGNQLTPDSSSATGILVQSNTEPLIQNVAIENIGFAFVWQGTAAGVARSSGAGGSFYNLRAQNVYDAFIFNGGTCGVTASVTDFDIFAVKIQNYLGTAIKFVSCLDDIKIHGVYIQATQSGSVGIYYNPNSIGTPSQPTGTLIDSLTFSGVAGSEFIRCNDSASSPHIVSTVFAQGGTVTPTKGAGCVLNWNSQGDGTIMTGTAIGATSSDGVIIENPTAATVGAQKWSPRIRLTGRGWKTDATAGSQRVDWIIEHVPVQGASSPTPSLSFSWQANGTGYTQGMLLTSGTLNVATGYQIGGAATSGHFLRGNGSIFVDGAIAGGDLPTSGVTANTYGSTTQIPQIAIDATGRITSASNQTLVAPAGTLTGTTLASNVVTSSIVTLGTLNSTALLSGATLNWGDVYLSRAAAASLQHGQADAAAPVAQTIGVQNVVAGTPNTAGAALTIAGSKGTGTGIGGSMLLQTASAGGSGTSQNSLSTRLTILGNGAIGTNKETNPQYDLVISDNTATGLLTLNTPQLVLAGADTVGALQHLVGFGTNAGPAISFFLSGGTSASRSATASGQTVGIFGFGAYNSSTFVQNAARIYATTTALWAAGDNGIMLQFDTTPAGSTSRAVSMTLAQGLGVGTTSDPGVGMIYTNAATFMTRTKTSWSTGAAAQVGTLTNAPAAGNPTKWIPVDDNGTTRYVPAW